MDCSEEIQSLSDEASTPMELKKGMSIFIDILRRADKNDDGKLSFEEFKAYFSDGVLTAEELKELFHAIDTHNTDNVDTDELCEYFSQHLCDYESVLAALEDLNTSILKAMDKTKKESPYYNEELISDLHMEISHFQAQGRVLLYGDLNARTGSEPNFIDPHGNNHVFGQNVLYTTPTITRQNSLDSALNKCGKDLVLLCRALSLYILNGRIRGDSGKVHIFFSSWV